MEFNSVKDGLITRTFDFQKRSLSITCDKDDWTIKSVFHEVLKEKIYETASCGIQAGDMVLDGGAHCGFFSFYAALRGAAEIIAIEPNMEAFRFLQCNVAKAFKEYGLNAHMHYFNHALWHSYEVVQFRASKASAGSNVTKPGHGGCRVIGLPIDMLNLKRLDWIKLDIEGSELQALRGARETIKRLRPRLSIALYHHPTDEEEIQRYVKSFDLRYTFEKSDGMVDKKGFHYTTGFWY